MCDVLHPFHRNARVRLLSSPTMGMGVLWGAVPMCVRAGDVHMHISLCVHGRQYVLCICIIMGQGCYRQLSGEPQIGRAHQNL